MPKDTERTRIELVESYAKFTQAREEFGFNLAVNGVIDPLVGGRLDVPVRLANHHDLGDFPPVVSVVVSVTASMIYVP